VFSGATLFLLGARLHSPKGPRMPWINSGTMNPRYRRMVIPGALVALILLVVVTAMVRG
jgi:hypothetical protein